MHETIVVIAEFLLLVASGTGLFLVQQQINWAIKDRPPYIWTVLLILKSLKGVFLALLITAGWLMYNSLNQDWDLLLLLLIADSIFTWVAIDFLELDRHRVVYPVAKTASKLQRT